MALQQFKFLFIFFYPGSKLIISVGSQGADSSKNNSIFSSGLASQTGLLGCAGDNTEWNKGPRGPGLSLRAQPWREGRDSSEVVSQLQNCPHLPVDPALPPPGPGLHAIQDR